MPIYEYRCEQCGHELEVMQKLADAPLTDCPSCEQSTLKKKISAVGFRLKGSGWYETDFKTGNKKNVAESKSSGDSSTSSGAETKSSSSTSSEGGSSSSSSSSSSSDSKTQSSPKSSSSSTTTA